LITAVLDANVLVSGLISNAGPPGQILDSWMDGKFQLFVSPRILDELKRVLHYPRIRQRLMQEQIAGLLQNLDQVAGKAPGTLRLDVLTRDPSDNIYLACAIEAKAQYLVTGNMTHFEEAITLFPKMQICTPREFLTVISMSQML
jgi:putative PIN family toxin of toxin-antitoxin system